eukprot:TRINITY_DN16096_c0_g1_i1.p1 TRINITY_DN16096_c0_g1~~TRINITY_DN16096_c0_g1_i1.p1  ORF type:complete len:167 (+),score=31.22 TRINITY_DN16096_c0_g1_i1:60-503(+)
MSSGVTYMVSVDGSEHAAHAFETARKLVRPEEDRLLLLTVCQQLGKEAQTDDMEQMKLSDAQGKLVQRSRSILLHMENVCKEENIPFRSILLESNSPREAIVQEAEKENVDVLIVGSRGLGTISRLLLGSVSDYCVHHSSCAVLVVK